MTESTLVILGNGFDLQSGLRSTYNDYFSHFIQDKHLVERMIKQEIELTSYNYYGHETFKNKACLDELSQFTFWHLIFFLSAIKDDTENWSDVEKIIHGVVIREKKDNYSKLFEMVRQMINKSERDNFKTFESSFVERRENRVQKNIGIMLFKFLQATNCEKEFLDSSENYFFNELLRFETNFRLYMEEQQANEEYFIESSKLFRQILNHTDTEFTKDISLLNIINFNYTKPLDGKIKYYDRMRNVHGDVNSEVIFGIDNKNISPLDTNYRFTKTSRSLHSENNLNENSLQKLLREDCQKIVFYGHSLGDYDYSYFQSLFDYFELYNGTIQLYFCFSVYDKSKKKFIKRNYTDSVISLVSKYGTSHDNVSKGENLLHKLILEERISIVEI